MKQKIPIKPIKSFLMKKDSPLSNLYKKAQSIKKTEHQLNALLDPYLQNHFELANINADVVTILVNNAAWATQFRYNIPTILEIVGKKLNLKQIKTIRIKIKKPDTDFSTPPKKAVFISHDTAQFLKYTAKDVSDPEIQNYLLKLSQNHS